MITLNKAMVSINGKSEECGHIVCDEVATMRLEDVLSDAGYYAMSMRIKSAGNGSVTFLIRSDQKTFPTSAAWERKEMITNVSSITDRFMEIQFAPGEYWIFHAKLEKGNKVSDWSL